MRECERVWLNIPEGTRIGKRMAVLWRTNFSGYGKPPTRDDLRRLEFWPEGQLRALRSAMVQVYAEAYRDAKFVHPLLRKEQLVKSTYDHKITIEIMDWGADAEDPLVGRHRNVVITFHHDGFATDPAALPNDPSRPWQIQCGED